MPSRYPAASISPGPPGAQRPFTPLDLPHVHLLVIRVRLQRVAGTVVHGGHAELAEPGDVGPAVLRQRLAAHRGEERLGGRPVKTGTCTARRVGQLDLVAGEQLAQVVLGVLDALARREAVVDS